LTSRYASEPNCSDCGKKKGPNQRNNMRCFRCQKIAERKASESKHDSHIQRHFGISRIWYKALMAFQGGRCAICCRATGRTKRLAVDHNHSCKAGHAKDVGCPECIRGLLCSTCNTYIGRVHDDPRVGERMARYLRDPPFQILRRDKAA
jgi:hypothetical protein